MIEVQKKIPVGVLGATGMVGQHFVRFLQDHPWFEFAWAGASDRSAGKPYEEATEWRLEGEIPRALRGMKVNASKPHFAPKLVFSAMDASVATEIEQEFARAGHIVVSNSRNHRMEPDVPLLVPEVNPGHLQVLERQGSERGWSGRIVTNPNCSTVVLTMALEPLKKFGLRRVIVTTMQAVSGAGYPGVASMDILGNVVPYIGSEEEKMESETQKILGEYSDGNFVPLPAAVSAQCNRVASVDGHIMTVSVEWDRKPTLEEVRRAFQSFKGLPQQKGLPSAPPCPVIYTDLPDRPQPRRDASRENGMATFIGRLRDCPVLHHKFVACGHNTIRGAAGAAVLNAELMLSEGLLPA